MTIFTVAHGKYGTIRVTADDRMAALIKAARLMRVTEGVYIIDEEKTDG